MLPATELISSLSRRRGSREIEWSAPSHTGALVDAGVRRPRRGLLEDKRSAHLTACDGRSGDRPRERDRIHRTRARSPTPVRSTAHGGCNGDCSRARGHRARLRAAAETVASVSPCAVAPTVNGTLGCMRLPRRGRPESKRSSRSTACDGRSGDRPRTRGRRRRTQARS